VTRRCLGASFFFLPVASRLSQRGPWRRSSAQRPPLVVEYSGQPRDAKFIDTLHARNTKKVLFTYTYIIYNTSFDLYVCMGLIDGPCPKLTFIATVPLQAKSTRSLGAKDSETFQGKLGQ